MLPYTSVNPQVGLRVLLVLVFDLHEKAGASVIISFEAVAKAFRWEFLDV